MERQALALADITPFMAVHARRAEILSNLYSHVAGLNSLVKNWLRLNASIEKHRELARRPNEQQDHERLQEVRVRTGSMERQLIEAYKIMVDEGSMLSNVTRQIVCSATKRAPSWINRLNRTAPWWIGWIRKSRPVSPSSSRRREIAGWCGNRWCRRRSDDTRDAWLVSAISVVPTHGVRTRFEIQAEREALLRRLGEPPA